MLSHRNALDATKAGAVSKPADAPARGPSVSKPHRRAAARSQHRVRLALAALASTLALIGLEIYLAHVTQRAVAIPIDAVATLLWVLAITAATRPLRRRTSREGRARAEKPTRQARREARSMNALSTTRARRAAAACPQHPNRSH